MLHATIANKNWNYKQKQSKTKKCANKRFSVFKTENNTLNKLNILQKKYKAISTTTCFYRKSKNKNSVKIYLTMLIYSLSFARRLGGFV